MIVKHNFNAWSGEMLDCSSHPTTLFCMCKVTFMIWWDRADMVFGIGSLRELSDSSPPNFKNGSIGQIQFWESGSFGTSQIHHQMRVCPRIQWIHGQTQILCGHLWKNNVTHAKQSVQTLTLHISMCFHEQLNWVKILRNGKMDSRRNISIELRNSSLIPELALNPLAKL